MHEIQFSNGLKLRVLCNKTCVVFTNKHARLTKKKLKNYA